MKEPNNRRCQPSALALGCGSLRSRVPFKRMNPLWIFAVLEVAAVASKSTATNPGANGELRKDPPAVARRTDVISPHFPQEGVDYLTGNRVGVIFDMSNTSGTVLLAEGIEVPRPTSIATVKPSSDLIFESETSSVVSLSQLSSKFSKSYGEKWELAIPFQKKLGVEIGGSRDTQLRWARAQMQEKHRNAVLAKVSYNYVEITTKPPVNSDLSEEFLRAFLMLPRGEWKSLSEGSKQAYSSFFRTYGTHYVRAAKFGGSYESIVIAEACALVIASEQGSNLADCVNLKLSFIFQDVLGIDADIFSAGACHGLTSQGSATDAWVSSTIRSKQRWLGGSYGETDALQFTTIGAWIEDIKRNPRSFPTQLSSVPDLFRNLHGAYSWGEDYCIPCQTLKSLNLNQETFGTMVRNLDLAFDEYLFQARNETLATEECTLKCGSCGRNPPLDDCTCPQPNVAACTAGDEDVMEVSIRSVNAKVEYDWTSLYSPQSLRIQTSGLGSAYDGKVYKGGNTVSMAVSLTFTRKKGETVRVEVYDEYLGIKKCVGSAEFLLELVGSGHTMGLNGPCTSPEQLFGDQRVGKNPTVWMDGSVKFPNCCDCELEHSAAHPRNSRFGAISFFTILFIFHRWA